MYFDNLTIAGILMLTPYALLPFLFGREIMRVSEDQGDSGPPVSSASRKKTHASDTGDCGRPEPCH